MLIATNYSIRGGLVLALALSLLEAPRAADAQPMGKVYRIGILSNAPSPTWEAFRQGLRELGYIEDRNIAIESRWSEGKYDRLPNLAAELVWLKVDIIATAGTPAARAAKQATSTIPIVMVVVSNPVESGLEQLREARLERAAGRCAMGSGS